MAASPSPEILIVTPLLNGERFLAACLRNVETVFSGLRYRHVVVDAGSSDASSAIFTSERVQNAEWLSIPGCTIWKAINSATRLRKFDVLYQLNVDDLVLPSIRRAIHDLFLWPDATRSVMVGGCVSLYLQTSEFRIKWVPYEVRPAELLGVGAYIPQPSTLIGAEVFGQVGFFSETLRYAGDTEFWLRCQRQGVRFVASHDILAIDRVHATNLRFSPIHIAEIEELRKKLRLTVVRKMITKTAYMLANLRAGLGKAGSVRGMFSPQSDLLAAWSFLFGNRRLILTLPSELGANSFSPKGRLI